MGHFNHQLSSKRGCKSLKRKDPGLDQVGAALDCAQQLPSRRTSAPCDTATQTSGIELCGFLQLNDRQMLVAGRVRHVCLPGLSAGCGQGQSGQGYAWSAAERIQRGQFLGSGRGGTVCLAMKVLFKKLEKLSGQAGDNARERLDLLEIGEY